MDFINALCFFMLFALFFLLLCFAHPISEVIYAKAEEIRVRSEKLKQENHDEHYESEYF